MSKYAKDRIEAAAERVLRAGGSTDEALGAARQEAARHSTADLKDVHDRLSDDLGR